MEVVTLEPSEARRVLGSQYFTIAATPRFRATQRRRMRDSARQGMVLVVAAAALNSAGIGAYHPDTAAFAIWVNVLVAAAAIAGYVAIATFARRWPEVVLFATLLAVDAATVAVGGQHLDLRLLSAGYLLLLPAVVALLIPWATWVHVAWLVLHAGFVVIFSVVSQEASLLASDRSNLLVLLAVATLVSQLGHVTNLRARIASFVQIEHIRSLNRQATRDHLRLDRLNERLEQSAVTDELTGLKNRLGLTRDLAIVRSRVERLSQGYGLLMLDLDRFKAINDSRGHLAGDDVLRATANAVAATLRPGDWAYRYGGEEFVVLMALKEERDAIVAAERIRHAVEALDIPNTGNEPFRRVTISVGVAVITSGDTASDDEVWLARADAALYRAKVGGRNRSEEEPSTTGEARNEA